MCVGVCACYVSFLFLKRKMTTFVLVIGVSSCKPLIFPVDIKPVLVCHENFYSFLVILLTTCNDNLAYRRFI